MRVCPSTPLFLSSASRFNAMRYYVPHSVFCTCRLTCQRHGLPFLPPFHRLLPFVRRLPTKLVHATVRYYLPRRHARRARATARICLVPGAARNAIARRPGGAGVVTAGNAQHGRRQHTGIGNNAPLRCYRGVCMRQQLPVPHDAAGCARCISSAGTTRGGGDAPAATAVQRGAAAGIAMANSALSGVAACCCCCLAWLYAAAAPVVYRCVYARTQRVALKRVTP